MICSIARIRLPFGALALLVAALGCASSSNPAPYGQEHVIVDSPTGRSDLLLALEQYLSSDTLTVAAARDWPSLEQSYAAFGVPLQGADAARRVIATQYFHAHSSFA